jgi:hypothetical protein
MTRDQSRRLLVLYAMSIVERFVDSRDAALAKVHPETEWETAQTIEVDFMEFLRQEVDRFDVMAKASSENRKGA